MFCRVCCVESKFQVRRDEEKIPLLWFHIVWDAKDRGHTSGLLKGRPCRAEDATQSKMNIPCSPGGLARGCSGQDGGITAKSFAVQSIVTSASMEFRFLCSYCVSLTLNSKNLKEEDSLQGINLRYPELHEQSQICALFYQKLNFDLLQWNIMRNTFGNKLK